MVLAIVLTVLAAWVLGAVVLAFVTGEMIHAREEHDRPVGGRHGERAPRRHALG